MKKFERKIALIILLSICFTFSVSNVSLASNLNGVNLINSNLQATASFAIPANQILEIIEALIKALGATAALALLRDIMSDRSLTLEKVKERKIVPIYRWGSHTNTNLTPRPQDITGLSFSLTCPTNSKFVMTTIQAVNNTKVLVAIVDRPRPGRRPDHVSVKPNPVEGANMMNNWIASRPNAERNPFYLTRALRGITVPVTN